MLNLLIECLATLSLGVSATYAIAGLASTKALRNEAGDDGYFAQL